MSVSLRTRVPARRLVASAAALLLASGLAACSGSEDSSGSSGTDAEQVTLTVFAAASLTQSFTEIGQQFEKANPGVTVRFSFGGSSDLVEQISSGAPADVFASADEKNMDKVGDDATDPEDFATNTLEIAVPPDNPGKVEGLDDLARKDVKVVLCAPEVPCGAAAAKVEQAAGVSIAPVSEEQSVTDVLGKVTSGEADAGLVYVTDVKGAGDAVVGVPFPESADAVNTYPISVLSGAGDRAKVAQEFVAFVLGAQGRKVLTDAGFGAP